jgi:hypothetical protein
MPDLNTVLQILLGVILMILSISSFIDVSKMNKDSRIISNANGFLAFMYLILGIALIANKVMSR